MRHWNLICGGLACLFLTVLFACGGGGRGGGAAAPRPAAPAAPANGIENVKRAAPLKQELAPANDAEIKRAAERQAAQKNEAELDGSVDYAAREFAIKIVSPRLKSPTSASFPKDTVGVGRLPDVGSGSDLVRRWQVSGKVDAPNSFGVPLRMQWNMDVAHAGDKFFPVAAWLDGELIFESDRYSRFLDAAHARQMEELEQEKRDRRDARVVEAKQAAANRDPEQKAAADLALAKSLLAQGRKEPAHKRLNELVEKYPDTKAAAEAKKLLK